MSLTIVSPDPSSRLDQIFKKNFRLKKKSGQTAKFELSLKSTDNFFQKSVWITSFSFNFFTLERLDTEMLRIYGDFN